jgi:hypothetical protein
MPLKSSLTKKKPRQLEDSAVASLFPSSEFLVDRHRGVCDRDPLVSALSRLGREGAKKVFRKAKPLASDEEQAEEEAIYKPRILIHNTLSPSPTSAQGGDKASGKEAQD